MKVDNRNGVNGNDAEAYGDVNNKRIKYNPTELRTQSIDRAHHGRSLKWKYERVMEKGTERDNKETEKNGNMKERRRMDGNAREGCDADGT